MEGNLLLSGVSKRKCIQIPKLCAKKEKKASLKKVSLILRKCESQRTEDERILLLTCGEEIAEIESRQARSKKIKDRCQEVEDPPDVLLEKCKILIEAVSKANHLVVYTGAGISTSAQIPDYRGSQGIWTLLQKGKEIGNHDLSQAEPTLTHMALYELHRKGLVKYIVSQNCDGLHLRSGLPKAALSEVHGNMYIEVCRKCQPIRSYWRLFDTTELTGRYTHKTRRKCRHCGDALIDSIVHFGERGTLPWPLNWKGAIRHSEQADVILCLGSSLKVLKRYPWLWAMDRPAKKRPKIYIVNLQWTPKDESAILKINGRCDEVIRTLMAGLQINIPKYERHKDPLFAHATPLQEQEEHTTTQPILTICKVLNEHCEIESVNDKVKASSDCGNEVSKNDFANIDIKQEVKDLDTNNKSFINYDQNMIEIKIEHSLDIKTENEGKDDESKINIDKLESQNEIISRNNKQVTEASSNNTSINNSPLVCDKQLTYSNPNTMLDNKLTDADNLLYNIKSHVDLSNNKYNEVQENDNELVLDNKMSLKKSVVLSPTKSSLFSIDSILNLTKSQEIEVIAKKPKLMIPRYQSDEIARKSHTNDKIISCIKNNTSSFRNKCSSNISIPNYSYDHVHLNNFAGVTQQQNVFNRFLLNPVQPPFINLSQPFTFGYYEALLNYYETLSQSVPQLGHSKLVYSGLHSIIPIKEHIFSTEKTTYKENKESKEDQPSDLKTLSAKHINKVSKSDLNKKEKQEDLTQFITNNEYDISQQLPKNAECDFCKQNYKSYICLFYKREQDNFSVVIERKGKTIFCVCCDYSDSSEDEDENNISDTSKKDLKSENQTKEINTVVSDDSDSLIENDSEEKNDAKDNKIQAGWFGKGYRKNRKKRRT